MIFENIRMKNFRSHEDLEFDFTPNRFCIIAGPNGVGKTTIFDALVWALYDVTTKGRKGDSVIRKRAGKNTSVVLNFSIDDDKYEIENYRKHSTYHDDKILKKNGKDITGATRALTNEKIVNILMPKNVFLNCIMFSQYITKSFTEMGDAEQKNIFDQMMGFSRYDDYSDNIKSSVKDNDAELIRINEKLLLIDPALNRNKELIKDDKINKGNSIVSYTNQRNDILKTIAMAVSSNKDLEKKTLDLDNFVEKEKALLIKSTEVKTNLNEVLNKYNNNKETITTKYRSKYNEETAKINELYKDKLNNLDKNIENTSHEKEISKQKLDNSCETLKTKYFEHKKSIDDPYNTKLSEIRDKRNEISIKLAEINGLSKSNQTELQNKNEEIRVIENKLSEEIPKCYACGQDIKDSSLQKIKDDLQIKTNNRKELDSKNIALSKNRDECTKVVNKLDSDKINYDEIYNSKLEKLNDWKAKQLNDLQSKWNKQKIEFDENCKTLENNRKSISDEQYEKILTVKNGMALKCNKELTALKNENQDTVNNLKRENVKLSGELNIVKTKLEKVRGFKDSINSNNATIVAKKEELENVKRRNKETNDEYVKRIKSLEKDIIGQEKTRETFIESVSSLNRKANILKFWKGAFSSKGIRGILLDDSIPTLNEYASALSKETDSIRVRFDSQRPLKSGKLKNEFCVLPIQTRNLTDERGDFSSGEGRMVDIITLLSLRHLLEKTYDISFNISLFDEILDSLDISNAEIVSGFLRRMSETSCTVLITHTLRNNIEADELLEF